jgi:hypothetical protein
VTPETPAPDLIRGLVGLAEAPGQARGGYADQVRGGDPDQVRGGVASTTRNVKATLTRPRNPLKFRAWPFVSQWANRKGYPG